MKPKILDCIFLAETPNQQWQLEVNRIGTNNFEVKLIIKGMNRGKARGYSYLGITTFIQDNLNKAKIDYPNYEIKVNKLSDTLK